MAENMERLVWKRRLDEKTWRSLSRYSSERRKFAKTSTIVSTLIASILGLALTVSAIFPQSSVALVAVVSTILGALVAWFSFWERHKEERRLITHLLGDENLGSQEAIDPNLAREIIERSLWAEDL